MIMANSAEATVETGGKVYEVADFFSIAPNKDYVLVSHYRTVQHDGGHTVNEPVATTEELIAEMIRAFDGLSSSVPQGLRGVFQQTGDARECAAAIVTHHGKQTEVVGSELLVFL